MLYYYVISADTVDELVQEMNQWLKDDWRPLGGIAVSTPEEPFDENGFPSAVQGRFHQALHKSV